MCEFAVVDTETTGLPNRRANRVVELAIIRLSSELRIVDEFETLLNPERDIGPTSIHGIPASSVVSAPCFEEIAGDVLDRIQGCILVAHNVRFDATFLSLEFGRLGVAMPLLPALCTMQLARGIRIEWPSADLEGCCSALGIPHTAPHEALSDARATVQLFSALVRHKFGHIPITAKQLNCVGTFPWYVDGKSLKRSKRTWSRAQACIEKNRPSELMPQLIQRLSKCVGLRDVKHEVAGYLNALDHVLEDRIITPDEVEALFETAKMWELGPEEVSEAHRLYIRRMAAVVRRSTTVSEAQLNDLKTVNSLLGFDEPFLDSALQGCSDSPKIGRPENESLSGQSVCFTGECCCTIQGEFITRDVAFELATRAGLSICERVTKNLDLLVVADPLTQSGKAKKAREYGIRIIHEPVFWRSIGVCID